MSIRIRREILLAILFLVASLACRADEPVKPLLEFSRPVTIVCLGDSVTGVYYHTGGLRAYPEMLEIALRQVYPKAQIKVVNAGISGHTAELGLNRLDRDVLSHSPDLVTISFGLNDMTRAKPDDFRKNLDQIIARCREKHSQVMLCTPNAVIDTAGRPRTRLVEYCEIIRQLARDRNVPLCDQYQAGEALRTRDAWAWRLTLSDEIHPNMAGHKAMAEELCLRISGQRSSLERIGPPSPRIPRTLALLKEGKPVKVLAMTPCDGWVASALKSLNDSAAVEITPWKTDSRTLMELENEAQATVRKLKPDLVVLAVPRTAEAPTDEQFVKSYSWIMNWSLSFGRQEWDCLVVHPSVTDPQGKGAHDQLVRTLVQAQHLMLIDRPADSTESPEAVLIQGIREAANH